MWLTDIITSSFQFSSKHWTCSLTLSGSHHFPTGITKGTRSFNSVTAKHGPARGGGRPWEGNTRKRGPGGPHPDSPATGSQPEPRPSVTGSGSPTPYIRGQKWAFLGCKCGAKATVGRVCLHPGLGFSAFISNMEESQQSLWCRKLTTCLSSVLASNFLSWNQSLYLKLWWQSWIEQELVSWTRDPGWETLAKNI